MQSLFAVHNNGSTSLLQGQLGRDENDKPILVNTNEETAAQFVEMYPKVHIFVGE